MRLFILAIACAATSTTLFAQDTQKQEAARREMLKQLELTKPGQEHAELKNLAGDWNVLMIVGGRQIGAGTAQAATIIGDRFFVLDGELETRQKTTQFRFTIGYDRRNSEYEITLFDSAGTYSVSARGKREQNTIRMIGTDNDPFMKKKGFDKKFAFDLKLVSEDEFSIATIYIDNRTKTEKFIPSFEYQFKRNN